MAGRNDLDATIQELKEQRRRAKAEAAATNRAIKANEKKRKRLLRKASGLSEGDLLWLVGKKRHQQAAEEAANHPQPEQPHEQAEHAHE